ncbi:CVNH domain-containing protein [Colletotrichum cereale]|nr:CVNH domain-containing protein [Colletotrichum cereale]
MKDLGIFAALSVIAASVSARECPLESDCIQKLCKNIKVEWAYNGIPSAWNFKSWYLTANCKDNAGKKTFTQLRLDECIGNVNGEMFFSPKGDFNCDDCKIAKTDPLIMECSCKNKGGKKRTNEINLSEGIWTYDGGIGCYQTSTHKSPGIGDF